MKDTWEDILSCAVACDRCGTALAPDTPRILSIRDHQAICMECKRKEEAEGGYADASKEMIGQCMLESEAMYGDPGGYCYHHFYPYTCKSE